jgi:hypothetical protein
MSIEGVLLELVPSQHRQVEFSVEGKEGTWAESRAKDAQREARPESGVQVGVVAEQSEGFRVQLHSCYILHRRELTELVSSSTSYRKRSGVRH